MALLPVLIRTMLNKPNRRVIGGLALFSALVCIPAVAQQDSHYDFLSADLSSGSYDRDLSNNSNVTSLAIGYSSLYSERWLVVADYSSRFIHPQDSTVERYSLRPGVGYRYLINDQWDVTSRVRAGAIRQKIVNDITDSTIRTDTEFVYGIDVALSYSVNKNFDLAVFGEMSRSDIADENIVTLRGDYYFNTRFGMGAFYTHRDEKNYTVNEGGVSLRYLF